VNERHSLQIWQTTAREVTRDGRQTQTKRPKTLCLTRVPSAGSKTCGTPCNANQEKEVRGISCSLAAALLLLRATRAMRPVLRGGRMLVCPSRWWMRSMCVCVCVCVPARTVPSTRGIAPAVFAPRPSAPCCSYWPRLNMLPLRPRSTSSGARPDQLAPTQRASSFNRRTKVRKAWCLRPGTHQQNDSAKSRQHTLLGPRNRQALPLLLTEATP
jgi:hypothetical protein